MAQVVIRVLLSVTVTVITLLGLPSTTEADYLYHICPNSTVFIPNSTFQSNLNHLFSVLSSNATRDTGFYNATVGRTPTDTVYGLFLCRGDVIPAACKSCVTTATSEVVTPSRCPVEKQVVIWYDDCMLRYSNQSFFSIAAESPGLFMWTTDNITAEPNRFNESVKSILTEVAMEASIDDHKFATKEENYTALLVKQEANYTGLITLYSLGQCTQDLSSYDCNSCLRDVLAKFPTIPSGKLGARILNPSCNFRYEVNPFYKFTSAKEPAPAAHPLPPPTSVSKGANKSTSEAPAPPPVPALKAYTYYIVGLFW